jgi:PHS family inorganic phosphate transporter-like MFS transporter
MRVEGWIYFWRIVLGFGIGAEYPVTAIIAAEVSCLVSYDEIGSASHVWA